MPRVRTATGPTPAAPPLELSWEMFGELCRALALKVHQSGFHPDLVIGIAKAGVIPGAVIASILRCDFFSMKITRREGVERVRERPEVLSAAPVQAKGRYVLIVDEICTTGETLRLALAAVRAVNATEVRTAVSLVRRGGWQPDFHALETDAPVIFPWDRQIVADEGDFVDNPIYREFVG